MFAQFKIFTVDVIIPLNKGSVHGNLELRYCLRSIEKYLPDVENVFIIGQKPSFLRNAIHVPFADNPERKFTALNIYRKIQAACADKRVSDDFYFFSDDHFLLSGFVPAFYSCGSLADSLPRFNPNQAYHKTLYNTFSFLKGGNNFNVHCPIVYNKERFAHSLSSCRWRTPYGFAIKSIYCNINELPGTYIPDLKIKMALRTKEIEILIKGRPFFSIGDTALNNNMMQILNDLYPEKSQYES